MWNLELVEIPQDAPDAPVTPDAPSAPVATAATIVQEESFRANWNAVTGAIKYFLDVSTVSNFATFVTGYENKDIGNNLGNTVTGLTGETDYYYRVRAYDAYGQTSANSNTITLETLAADTYQLYTNTDLWVVPEPSETEWTVRVQNYGSVTFNDNFKVNISGVENDETPFSIDGYSAVTEILALNSADVVSTLDTLITPDWDTSAEFTLTIWYDSGGSTWVLLATKTLTK
jgi:hypothetical protein